MAFKVVLAYSGGLDTSVIVPWLRETYGAEVVCMAADVGQSGGLNGLEKKAMATGAAGYVGADLRTAFVEGYVWPTLRAGAVYGRKYLLGTAVARPIIARRQVELARELGATALAHGCTGKGNDQVRFELTFQALAPDLRVIAPWREWSIRSREDALAYARERGVPLDLDETKLYSRDENLWHISHEGGPLEDPEWEPDEEMFLWTTPPESAPERAERVEVGFERGIPVSVNGEVLAPVDLLETLNAIGSRHGVGRADVVEDRLVGMKSRGVYETPGGTLLHTALRELEQLTLHRRSLSLKDEIAPRYADLVYEGRWWTPEREALDALVGSLMERVTGTVRLKLYRGGVHVVGRSSPTSLYDEALATFGADGVYDQTDAEGFIRLFGLPMARGTVPLGMPGGKGDLPAVRPAAGDASPSSDGKETGAGTSHDRRILAGTAGVR